MVSKELAKRLSVAAFGVPLALALIHLGGWPLTLALALIAALAAREYYLLGTHRGIEPFFGLGMLGSGALVVLAGTTRSFEAFSPAAFGVLLSGFLLIAALAIWLRGPQRTPLASIPFTVGGMIYGGGCLSFAVFLRHLPDVPGGLGADLPFQGELLLILPLAATWLGDTAAYSFGRLLGKRKLFPSVSPGKTVVGGVAGLVTATLVGGLVGGVALALHPVPAVSALLGCLLGLVLGFAAQVGDLVESVLKREAGVKDSGGIFPGHGGILDRFDATLFTLPLAYALVRFIGAFQ